MTEEQVNTHPKAVTILTGFLGAGKTTFLNEWLHFRPSERTMVVENEFGAVNIDSQLLMANDEQVFSLTGGCICCGLNDDFSDLLLRLWEKRDSFDEIVVESTGIADPAQLVRPFLHGKTMSRYYAVGKVICVADASLIEAELATTEIARAQIISSNVILLSKTDRIPAEQKTYLYNMLREINPFAAVFSGNKWSGFPLEEITRYNAGMPDLSSLTGPESNAAQKTIRLRKYAHHDITTLHFSFRQPFDLDELKYRLLVFLNFQSQDIFRIKGIIDTKAPEQRVIIQTVADLLTCDAGRDWGPGETRQSDIVIIGRNLQSKGFEKMLGNCLYHSPHNIDPIS